MKELGRFAEEQGVPLTAEAMKKAEAYIELLKQYNAKTNLTAEKDEDALYLRHLADGFPSAAYLKKHLGAAPRVADLGSGGGFVGFGFKLAWPEAEVTLIEALQRKYDFLNMAAARSGLKGLRVLKARAGQDAVMGGYDAVVERALAPLDEAVALAVPLLKPGGLFVAYQSDEPDVKSVRAGARFVDMITYRLPREERSRRLAVFRREE